MRFHPGRFLLLGSLGVLLAGACGIPQDSKTEPSEVSARVALVVYDAGETLALLPVADRLEERGVEVEWVPLTPWAADLLAGQGRWYLPLPDGMEEMPHVEDRLGSPDTKYWETALARGPPGLVVLGMVSTAQGTLAAHLREVGILNRGIYDGFQPPVPNSVGARIAPAFDEIWVPTPRVQAGFQLLGFEAVVVGQPTLGSWRRVSEEVDVAAVRKRQSLLPQDRVLLFAGQYGDGYDELLDSFLRSIEATLASDPSLVLVLSHHPRTDGGEERAALERAGFGSDGLRPSGSGRAVMMLEELTTMQMATASEIILTWTSTVATQAAFMGKQVVYYSPPHDFDPYLVDQGSAILADEISLGALLAEALDHPASPEEIKKTLLDAGHVVDADLHVAAAILKALRG